MSGRRTALLVALALAVVAAPAAIAHELSAGEADVVLSADGTYVVEVGIDPEATLLRLQLAAGEPLTPRLPPARRDAALAQHREALRDGVTVSFDGARDQPELSPPAATATRRSAPDGGVPAAPKTTLRYRGTVPPGARAIRFATTLFASRYALTVRRAGGDAVETRWLDGGETSAALPVAVAAPSGWSVARQYLVVGYTHILPGGLDHILFVLGIFLLTTRLRPMLTQVTAFSVAHSITLGLSMYGVVSLPPSVVEPLIALSIVYVAVENVLRPRLSRWRVAVVFTFGLLHGLGFAGVLHDLGLPRGEFLTALLTFNLGVELGQLSVILAAFLAVGLWARRAAWYRARVVVPASLAIAAVGLLWTVERLLLL